MKRKSLARYLSMLGGLLIAGAASAADLHVMISAGFFGVYSELGPAFERASGHRLVTTRGPSMGDSPEAIPARLARGETADVVILDGGAADELGQKGFVRADSKVELARSRIGMVVRAGAAKPDIGSVEALRGTLLAAKSIAYSDSGSGTYLSTRLFRAARHRRRGRAQEPQGARTAVRRAGAAVVARGEAEIGFQQVAELIHVPGVTFVGTIPAEVQPPTFFAGALTRSVREAEAAERVAALPRFARGGAGDPQGRTDPALGTITARARIRGRRIGPRLTMPRWRSCGMRSNALEGDARIVRCDADGMRIPPRGRREPYPWLYRQR